MLRPDSLRPLTLLVFLALAACAGRRARDGAQAPEAGPSSAADALEQRLAETGSADEAAALAATLLESQVSAARTAREQGRDADAVRAWRGADALLERATALGVALDPPQGYADERALAFAALRARHLDEARAATVAGERERARACWAAVLALDPTDGERAEIERAGSDLLAAYAEAALERGDAEEAWNAAALALQTLPESEAELRERMLAVQEEAFGRASIRIALFPPWRTRRVARRMVDSNRFLLTLDNNLHELFREHEEAFIVLADPAGIHDTWNRMQYDGAESTPLRAAGVAALYGGQIAVTVLIDRVSSGDSIDRDTKTVRRKDGGTERYSLRTTTLDMSVRCRLRMIDVATRLILNEQEIESEAEIVGYVAAWDGDTSMLDLNRAEQDWFHPGQPARLAVEVRQAAARALAEDITTAVLSWLPRRRP